jgi:hypothetical protein
LKENSSPYINLLNDASISYSSIFLELTLFLSFSSFCSSVSKIFFSELSDSTKDILLNYLSSSSYLALSSLTYDSSAQSLAFLAAIDF